MYMCVCLYVWVVSFVVGLVVVFFLPLLLYMYDDNM